MAEHYYRICERKQSKLFTLFHAFGMPRSRELPMNEWLHADIKPVYDASKKVGKQYTSGFHVFKDPEECARFIKMFRAPRELVMVRILVGNTWPKSHSRANVLLTNKIKIIEVIKRLN